MTELFHFTHIEHLAGMVAGGLRCDADVGGSLVHEVGNRGIKERRRRAAVKVAPGGVVADYVPFYFAPRSPMMYAIHMGNVPGYDDGIDPLVYLLTSVERLVELDLNVVTTDRNAVLPYADHFPVAAGLDHIDWDLMGARYWSATADEPDRVERRMAECLVHRQVPWDAVTAVHVRTTARADEARAGLAVTGQAVMVTVKADWYF